MSNFTRFDSRNVTGESITEKNVIGACGGVGRGERGRGKQRTESESEIRLRERDRDRDSAK